MCYGRHGMTALGFNEIGAVCLIFSGKTASVTVVSSL